MLEKAAILKNGRHPGYSVLFKNVCFILKMAAILKNGGHLDIIFARIEFFSKK